MLLLKYDWLRFYNIRPLKLLPSLSSPVSRLSCFLKSAKVASICFPHENPSTCFCHETLLPYFSNETPSPRFSHETLLRLPSIFKFFPLATCTKSRCVLLRHSLYARLHTETAHMSPRWLTVIQGSCCHDSIKNKPVSLNQLTK